MRAAQVRAATGASQPGLEPVDNDYFRTGEGATRALLLVERFPGTVWEPACGSGDLARVLAVAPDVAHVHATDLVDRGYGVPGQDFLRCPAAIGVDHIVTNPPFELIDEFALKALSLELPGKIALFGRLAWLEGQRRRRAIFDVLPPARIWVFSARPKLARGANGEFQTGLIAFAWFVWQKGWIGPTQLGWI